MLVETNVSRRARLSDNDATTARHAAQRLGGGPSGARNSEPDTAETLQNKPDHPIAPEDESSPFRTAANGSERQPTAGETVSDEDLSRAIVQAVTAGAFDVARTLASELEDRKRRRTPENVIHAAHKFGKSST